MTVKEMAQMGGIIVSSCAVTGGTVVAVMLWLTGVKTDVAVLGAKHDSLTKDVASARQDAERDTKNLKESLEKDLQNLQRSIDRIAPPPQGQNHFKNAVWSGQDCSECPYDEEQGKFVKIDDIQKRLVFQLGTLPFQIERSVPIATDARIIEKGQTQTIANLKPGDEIAVLINNKRAEVQLVEIYKFPKPPPGSGPELVAPPGVRITSQHFLSVSGLFVRTDKDRSSLVISVQGGKGTSEATAPIADGSLVFINAEKSTLNALKQGVYIVAFYDTETRRIQLIQAFDEPPEVPPLGGVRTDSTRDQVADNGTAFSPLPPR
jgi:hypothetical protein